jgi:outer membrane lipopolysaccharide assembly protein LptE/RlpB
MVRALISLLCVVLVSGCGYTFRGSGSSLPPDVKKIYIPSVENNSTQIGLGDVMTNALREEFESYGAVSVVERQSEADAVLKVQVVDVKQSTSATRSNSNTSLQMDTTMFVAGELRRVSGPLLWRENRIRVTKTYGADQSAVVTSSPDFASGSISSQDLAGLSSREISRGQEQDALGNLAVEAARQVYDKAVAPDF